MTHDELVNKLAESFYNRDPIESQEHDLDWRPVGPAYTVPWSSFPEYDEGVHEHYLECATAALAIVYEAMIAPNNRMLKAACKAMSPEKRPTQDWVSARDKHAYRFMAMIEASPLKPVNNGESSQ